MYSLNFHGPVVDLERTSEQRVESVLEPSRLITAHGSDNSSLVSGRQRGQNTDLLCKSRSYTPVECFRDSVYNDRFSTGNAWTEADPMIEAEAT
jgi:hypothetical protein